MTEQEQIKQQLEEKFAFLKDKVEIKRSSRMFAEIGLENFDAVFYYLVDTFGFVALSTITGLDAVDRFQVIYYLNKEGKLIFTLKVNVGKENPVIKTITARFPNADIYEREVMDLLGIKVEGLAPGQRYPLPENFPIGEYPLRKDWKQTTPPKEGSENA